MKTLLTYYFESSKNNTNAGLLRDTVNFMNSRSEHLNDNKSFQQIIKEYLIFYKKCY
mgnify:CR=1 FL=1